ncbi:MAG: Maf family protein [Bacillota bacterium]
MELILASVSPRRRELLEMIGLEFSIIPSDVDEGIDEADPGRLVERLAHLKASSVRQGRKDCCVIGSDTVVVLDGKIIGKPGDERDAERILKLLRGRTHTVYTGLAVLSDEYSFVSHDKTLVTFAAMTDAQINAYVASGEPLDKAGAYGIQGVGGVFVERVEGCYFTVIGMPLPMLYRALTPLGILPKQLAGLKK